MLNDFVSLFNVLEIAMFAALTHNILLQMKKILSLLLTGLVLTFFSCQQDFESEFESLNGMGDDEEVIAQPRTSMSVASNKKLVFMPVDSVPEWIKDKVSAEEYQLWKTLSSKFSVDYSILEYPLTDKQKGALYTSVSAFAKDIESGKITRYMGRFTGITLANVATAQRKMLKNRSESGGDGEIKYRDTGFWEICYIEEAKSSIDVGAEYAVQGKEVTVTYPYYRVRSAYNADYSGYPSASYQRAHQVIRFVVSGSLVYMHPQYGFTQTYFPTCETYAPVYLD